MDIAEPTADVCIVGAGIAGLNAAFVASRYLGRNGRIVILDRRERAGGMWVDTYDYVRLHQPHRFFTAGNIKWTSGKKRSYLATKSEVLEHLSYCLDVIGKRTNIEPRWGAEYQSHRVANGLVTVEYRDRAGTTRQIVVERLIKAYGIDPRPNPPLSVTSSRVRSVSPDSWDFRSAEMRESKAPVWIIGGGKTAMDTANVLVKEYPGREVNLLAGSGTYFTKRDRLVPNGLRRWIGGVRTNQYMRDAAIRFDGTNEDVVRQWALQNYTHAPTPGPRHYFYGILSNEETQTIASGVNEVISDHLVDVVDRDGAPELVLRSGARKPIHDGSWIVNCTGYIFRHDRDYEPYCSADGAVLSIQNCSSTMLFSSFGGYFLTHLMFLDQLTKLPLYEVDLAALHRDAREAFPWVIACQVVYNLGLMIDAVPMKVFLQCGLDYDHWYPMPRQLGAAVRLMATLHRDRPHLKQSLDTIRERYGLRCGPLAMAE